VHILDGIPAQKGTTLNLTCVKGYGINGVVFSIHQPATCIEGALWRYDYRPCEGETGGFFILQFLKVGHFKLNV